MSRRGPVVLAGSVVLLVVSVVLGVRLGPVSIPFRDVIGIVAQRLHLPVDATWPAWQSVVVIDVRMPRVVVGACVGGGLALCGAALQGLFRNPLADPGVIGVSNGASLGAVIALYMGLATRFVWALPVVAFIGASVTAFAVYIISTRRGRADPTTFILAGVAIGSLNAAITSFIISMSLADYQIGRQMVFWLMGGLDGRTWDHAKVVIPATLIGSALILAHAKELDALLVGEAHAASVGVDVPGVRRRVVIATALVTGVAVCVSGVIGFVGLVIPHILRLLIGPRHQWLLPASMILGAGFLTAADIVARTLIAPEEIRLGVITAAVGAPFFLFLLMRNRLEGTRL